MIYKELNETTFAYELSNNKDNWFSYNWASALYNFLDDAWMDIEFDPVALRCEYSEYSKEELLKEYWTTFISWAEEEYIDYTEEEKEEATIDFIKQNTLSIEVDDDTYIIQDF